MKLPELKIMLKQQNIRGGSFLNKPEIIDLLLEKKVITPEIAEREKQPREPKPTSTNKKYDRLKYIRKQPRPVDILDLETGEVASYPSIYKAAKALKQGSRTVYDFNGRVWRDRYEIQVYDAIPAE